MIKNALFIFFLSITSLTGFAQNDTLNNSVSESRNKNIRQILDYRYKGGAGAFERTFFANVEYTREAIAACVVGTVIISFTVDCDNNISELKMRNPLYFGLNEKIQAFFKATEGNWNTCTDDRYTRFEIPILFTIEGTQTSATGFIVLEGESPGWECKSDDYYFQSYEKYKEKGKTKKALEALDNLIRRDPYNQVYYDLKKDLLTKK